MKQLEILVLTAEMNEEDMYVLKFEKGRKFIENLGSQMRLFWWMVSHK